MRLAVGISATVIMAGLAVAGLMRLYSILDHDELVDVAMAVGSVLLVMVIIPGLLYAAVWGLS